MKSNCIEIVFHLLHVGSSFRKNGVHPYLILLTCLAYTVLGILLAFVTFLISNECHKFTITLFSWWLVFIATCKLGIAYWDMMLVYINKQPSILVGAHIRWHINDLCGWFYLPTRALLRCVICFYNKIIIYYLIIVKLWR